MSVRARARSVHRHVAYTCSGFAPSLSLPLPVRTARLTRVFIHAGSRETTRGPPGGGPRAASRADLVGDRLGVGRDQQVRGCRHFRLSTFHQHAFSRASTSLPPFSLPIEERREGGGSRWAEIIPPPPPILLRFHLCVFEKDGSIMEENGGQRCFGGTTRNSIEFFSMGGEDGIGRALNVGKYERRGQWHLPKNQSPLLFWLAPNAHLFEAPTRCRVCTRGPNLTKSRQMSIPNVIQVAVYRPPALVYTAMRLVTGGTLFRISPPDKSFVIEEEYEKDPS